MGFRFYVYLIKLTLVIVSQSENVPGCMEHSEIKVSSLSTRVHKVDNYYVVREPGNLRLSCSSNYPIEIKFLGSTPNIFKEVETSRKILKDTECFYYATNISSKATYTGEYECETKGVGVKKYSSSLYIFFDDGKEIGNFLMLLPPFPPQSLQIHELSTTNQIILPCVTFKPDANVSLVKNSDSCDISDWNNACLSKELKANTKFDPTKGFLINVQKLTVLQYTGDYFCRLNGYEIKITVSRPKDVVAKPAENVIRWDEIASDPLELTCSATHRIAMEAHLGINFESYQKNVTRFYVKNSYYSYIVKYKLYKNAIKPKTGRTYEIICYKPGHRTNALKRWRILFEGSQFKLTPERRNPSISYDPKGRQFYCLGSSTSYMSEISIVECNNSAACFEIKNKQLVQKLRNQADQPLQIKFGNDCGLSFKKQIRANDGTCSVVENSWRWRMGIAQCTLVLARASSRLPNSITQTIFFLEDLNGNIGRYENELEPKDSLTSLYIDVQEFKLLFQKQNTIDHKDIQLNVTCQGLSALYSKGFQIYLETEDTTYRVRQSWIVQSSELYDSYLITLRSLITLNIGEPVRVICSAPRWNSKEWVNITYSLERAENEEDQLCMETWNYVPHHEFTRYENTSIECSLICEHDVDPEFKWLRGNSSIIELTRSESIIEAVDANRTRFGKILVFKNVTEYHEALYTCEVSYGNTKYFILYDVTLKREPSAPWPWTYTLTIAMSCGALLCSICFLIFLIKILRRQKKTIERFTEIEINEFMDGKSEYVCSLVDLHDIAQFLPYKQEFEIDFEKLRISKTILGSGNFGVVLLGNLNDKSVAVKTVRGSKSLKSLRNLLAELKIMMYVGHHQNVIRLEGAITRKLKEGELYVVVELCSQGNMKDYLCRNRNNFLASLEENKPEVTEHSSKLSRTKSFLSVGNAFMTFVEKRLSNQSLSLNSNEALSIEIMLKWCYQIADGMEFLVNKRLIHGDLAARNVLLTLELNVKITDFGLSSQLYEFKDYRRKAETEAVPWKWLSIEALKYSKFSKFSDVWAFGITIWEIFTLGEAPYGGLCWGEEFMDYLLAGNRLKQPSLCPGNLYQLMLACWDAKAESRPSFSQIKEYLINFDTQEISNVTSSV